MTRATFEQEYSNLYDLIYFDKNYGSEVDYLIQQFGETPTRLLDYGCGTGRHSLEFSKRNIAVVGYDPSSTMLEHAKKRASQVEFTQSPVFDKKFSHITCLFAVFNYILGKAHAIETLQLFKKNLQEGGTVALDVWNGVAVPFLSERSKTKTFETPIGKVTRRTQTELDWVGQTLNVHFECELPNAEKISESHLMHYYTPQEMIEMASAAGFSVTKILPAYENNIACEKDFNLIFILN